jgi:hypothetical protein
MYLPLTAVAAAVTALLLSSSCHHAVQKTTSVPVMVGAPDPALDACPSQAVPKDPPSGPGVEVRSGPGARYELVDRLAHGTVFYLCCPDESGAWVGIVYPPDHSDPNSGASAWQCGVSTPTRRRTPYSGPCKSGWIPVGKYEVIAG